MSWNDPALFSQSRTEYRFGLNKRAYPGPTESMLQSISSNSFLWKRTNCSIVIQTWSWCGKPAASARAWLREAHVERGRAAARGFSPPTVRQSKFGISVRALLQCVVFLSVTRGVLILVSKSLLCSGSCAVPSQKTCFVWKIGRSTHTIFSGCACKCRMRVSSSRWTSRFHWFWVEPLQEAFCYWPCRGFMLRCSSFKS